MPTVRVLSTSVCLHLAIATALHAQAAFESALDKEVRAPAAAPVIPAVKPILPPKAQPEWESEERGIAWKGLLLQSGLFLTAQHAFRLATEPGTRAGLKGPFFEGYLDAVGNLHGWSDGDPFYVNYIGHPMQGAVAGFIWTHNDRTYRRAEFGKNREYWVSRLRAGAFAYVYSLQFELGPISEASIGKVQRDYPQQGWVDGGITPSIGLAWMIGEDAIDKYIILPLEGRYHNKVLRAIFRGTLNPSRTFANVMSFKSPWHRDTRPQVGKYDAKSFSHVPVGRTPPKPTSGVAPFEFEMNFRAERYLDVDGSCVGGGAAGAIRLAPAWQLVGDMGGCTLLGLPKNVTGDSYTFLTGPRWVPLPRGRWIPYLQFLLGANKVTQEYEDPAAKAQFQRTHTGVYESPVRPDYLHYVERSGLVMQAGGGIDYRLNQAIQLRIARLEFRHSWASPLAGRDYGRSLQFTTGLLIRVGTW